MTILSRSGPNYRPGPEEGSNSGNLASNKSLRKEVRDKEYVIQYLEGKNGRQKAVIRRRVK